MKDERKPLSETWINEGGVTIGMPEGDLLFNRVAIEFVSEKIAALERKLEKAEALYQIIRDWSKAYPHTAFPEPDLQQVKAALEARGITISVVSASNMRHVITRLMEYVPPEPEKP